MNLAFGFYQKNDEIVENKPFILQITTTTSNKSITIPHLIDYVYDYDIDYGDGSPVNHVTTYNGTGATHIYAVASGYTITISGTCETFFVNNGTFKLLPTKVLQWGNIGLKRLNFKGCTNLNSIVSDTYSGLSNVVNYNGSFYDCISLTTIPTDLFRHSTNVSVYGFNETFYNCSGITSIPTDLFRYATGNTTNGFTKTFYNCTGITSIPTDLFRYNTEVTSNGFSATFQNCYSLTSIPTDLFRYNTKVTSNGFTATFASCTSLTSIPTDLFRYNTGVTTSAFIQTFANCTSLTSIPIDLFRYNTAVSTNGFQSTFYNCASLTSIPTDLFRYNTAVSTYGFATTFYDCISLTSIPTDLFRYNTLCQNFEGTFQNCTSLNINPLTFYADGEQSTRFSGKTIAMNDCFYRTTSGDTASGGTAPDLWNCTFGGVSKTRCFGGTGNNATTLTNYTTASENGWTT